MPKADTGIMTMNRIMLAATSDFSGLALRSFCLIALIGIPAIAFV